MVGAQLLERKGAQLLLGDHAEDRMFIVDPGMVNRLSKSNRALVKAATACSNRTATTLRLNRKADHF